MPDELSQITLSRNLLEAIHTKDPADGYTHPLYAYPARFSPEFPRAVIRSFSKPSDVVLDPFMGSGTTLVEAMVAGRSSIGVDINPLAHFVATVKTTIIPDEELKTLRKWVQEVISRLNLHRQPVRDYWWIDRGYQKDLPWTLRKALELVLAEAQALKNPRHERLIRCIALSTGKWALDCTTTFPSVESFRQKVLGTFEEYCRGLRRLRDGVRQSSADAPSPAVCLNKDSSSLAPEMWSAKISERPSIVITSPPYPGVHVLYHRWQIKGRRETAAPYWIAGTPDGHGASHYTMGGRSQKGMRQYFETIRSIFSELHGLLAENALVFQLVGFSDIEAQLPKFLASMEGAGYAEVDLCTENTGEGERVWRQVPLRRWYASLQGETSSSREVMLVHRRANQLRFPLNAKNK